VRLLLSILLLCLAIPAQAAYNREIQLEATRLVENTSGWGKHGEFGPYQMTKAVRLKVGGYDKAAAMRWLIIVENDLKRARIDINSFNVGAAWNAGVGAVKRGEIPMSSYDYATRVANMAQTLEERAKPAPKPIQVLTSPLKYRFILP
jgi:hypothetical protein